MEPIEQFITLMVEQGYPEDYIRQYILTPCLGEPIKPSTISKWIKMLHKLSPNSH